ncbi:hypothetical protein CTAYLR_001908 [Chrysophaeum taylorii]|uniref:Uncharacterized protein n=1 Tax=Chrysophaeum taylorii TaxID=2483200 RepID=A0AAD7UAI2_9STRA|nr:hypothetical protein CTAYLR_001908 [Chrysophaeum taylorii]
MKPPRFRVSRTILVQSAFMLLPGALLYAIMKPRQRSPEELRADLEEKYAPQIKASKAQRDAMQQFFTNLKQGQRGTVADADQERKMQGLLTHGKSHVVRHYAYENPADKKEDGS